MQADGATLLDGDHLRGVRPHRAWLQTLRVIEKPGGLTDRLPVPNDLQVHPPKPSRRWTSESIYSALEDEVRARSQRDPADWPVVATALALSAGTWTGDNDFLGCGVPTWTTVTLQAWLDRHPT